MEGFIQAVFSEQGARWAQFIAAVVALIIAVWAPIRHADRMRRVQATIQVRSILAITEDAFSIVSPVPGDMGNREQIVRAIRKFPVVKAQSIAGWLEEIPIHALHDHRMAAPIVNLAAALEFFGGLNPILKSSNDKILKDFSETDHPKLTEIFESIVRTRVDAIAAVNLLRGVGVEYSLADTASWWRKWLAKD